jgi:hypothetical protein
VIFGRCAPAFTFRQGTAVRLAGGMQYTSILTKEINFMPNSTHHEEIADLPNLIHPVRP